jgi:hypothetical protein
MSVMNNHNTRTAAKARYIPPQIEMTQVQALQQLECYNRLKKKVPSGDWKSYSGQSVMITCRTDARKPYVAPAKAM